MSTEITGTGSNPRLSGVKEVVWPAVPPRNAAQIASVLLELEQTQWWPAERLRAAQFAQLRVLLKHAYQTAPFYRRRLDALGYKAGQEIDEALWSRIPLLTRSDIQLNTDGLRSNKVPKGHGEVRSSSTSGSTGQSLTVYGTDLNRFFWMVFTLREHLWHKRDFSQKLGVIRYGGSAKVGAPPHGSEGENWGPPASAVFSTGPAATLDISADISVQVAWLQKHQPGYLLTYPSNLEGLAKHCVQEGIRLSGLLQVRTISELLPPSLRELCQEAFGVPVIDAYSSNEAGCVAFECPDCGQYHVQAENALCEILDDDGNPCAPGESGRIVLTPLHNFAMPLLRYEIRDHAVVGDAGMCDRGLPVLKSILGRSRNMMIMPDGDKRWPTFLSWTELAPIAQYQIIQHAVDHLEARLVTHRRFTAEDEAMLTHALREQFGVPFKVTYTYLDELRGHENGKFEVFVSKVM